MRSNEFKVLYCTLRDPVITGDGDFIPAGTPVEVVGWAGGNGIEGSNRRIECRATAYMWSGEFDACGVMERRCGGCVGGLTDGLWFDVDPSNLKFRAVETMTAISPARA